MISGQKLQLSPALCPATISFIFCLLIIKDMIRLPVNKKNVSGIFRPCDEKKSEKSLVIQGSQLVIFLHALKVEQPLLFVYLNVA